MNAFRRTASNLGSVRRLLSDCETDQFHCDATKPHELAKINCHTSYAIGTRAQRAENDNKAFCDVRMCYGELMTLQLLNNNNA